MGLHGNPRVGFGVLHVSGRAAAGLALKQLVRSAGVLTGVLTRKPRRLQHCSIFTALLPVHIAAGEDTRAPVRLAPLSYHGGGASSAGQTGLRWGRVGARGLQRLRPPLAGTFLCRSKRITTARSSSIVRRDESCGHWI
jgi:hypothetical protein